MTRTRSSGDRGPAATRFALPLLVMALGMALLGGAAAPAGAAAPRRTAIATGVTVTLNAKVKAPKVSGDLVVSYKGGPFSTVLLSGTGNGLSGHPVAQLMGSWFPFKAGLTVVASEPLTVSGGKAPYTFNRTPSSATKYFVRLVASSQPGAATVGTSGTIEIYVTATVTNLTKFPGCGRPTCTISFSFDVTFPVSIAKYETDKYLYTYLGYNLSPTKEPPAPTTLKRWAFTVKKQLNSTTGEEVVKAAFSFKVGNDGYNYAINFCTQDSLTTDGFGLPGHHYCGDSTIPNPVPEGYLG